MTLASFWKVFLLFSIPIGGGIPAGVLVAQSEGIAWTHTALIYLLSDIVLACWFEPLIRFFIRLGRTSPKIHQFNSFLKMYTHRILSMYQPKPNPFVLVMIAFGVDPMTGRAVTLALSYGALLGWMIAIMGDMLFFFLVMSSTLWLNDLLGDGTLTAVIIMIGMLVIPKLLGAFKARMANLKSRNSNSK